VLAHGVVAQHGGRLHYASEVGRGTAVTVRLPPQPTCDSAAITTSTTLAATMPVARDGAAA
jgi:K+-sensing histidine kinase KdpD